jgi:hypothetical protein
MVAYFGVGWPMPHGGAVHDMKPCRHHAPRPGHADGARLCRPPAVAGIAAKLRTCGKTASSAGQCVTHSSEAQSGRRCRTRVEGVEGASAAENLGTLLTARGGSGLAGLGAGGVCGDRSRSRRVRIRRELRRQEIRRRHHLRQIFRKIGIKSRGELTRVVVQRSADSQQGGADTGLAAGARERRLPRRMHDCGAGVAVRHARPPAARQAPAALSAPPGRRPPTGPAPSRFPGRPRPAVPDRHRPEALLDSDGGPEGCPDRRRDGKEPQHAAPLSLCPSCSQGRNVRRCCADFGSSQTRVNEWLGWAHHSFG